MIRVNLLPGKREAQKRSAAAEGQSWVLLVAAFLLVEVVALFIAYRVKNKDLVDLKNKNQAIEADSEQIKKQISDHEKIKADLKELRDREDAITKLQSARTGPTNAMLELTRILSPGRGPTIERDKLEQLRRDNPLAVFNANWDTKRLWLSNYSEADRVVKITGFARDGEDVSEFLRRMSLSDYFNDVQLLPAQKALDPETKLELVKFQLSAKARY
jgi:type IV pilus assembly protein PilN